MSNINDSCTHQYRYSKGFDSCLFLHGEPLRLTLLICITSIFALFIVLLLMLITAKKLLPKLIKEKHGIIHPFLPQSNSVRNHDVQESIQPYTYSSRESQHSSAIDGSQLRSEEGQ